MITEDAYYLALGRFVHNFSEAEAAIHFVFHVFTKMPIPIAQAVKRESKASDLISIMKATAKLHNFPAATLDELGKLFAQFEHISSFRHRVIHRGARAQEDGTYLSSNVPTMKSYESFETATFSVSDVQAATRDLGRISIRLYWAANLAHPPQGDPDAVQRILLGPWRYIPVQLRTPNRPIPTKPPAPARQPPASQE
jgi:hypothetical protein